MKNFIMLINIITSLSCSSLRFDCWNEKSLNTINHIEVEDLPSGELVNDNIKVLIKGIIK